MATAPTPPIHHTNDDSVRLLHPMFTSCGNYVRIHTFADGSCFYHALAGALGRYSAGDSLEVIRQVGLELRAEAVGTADGWDAFLVSRGFGSDATRSALEVRDWEVAARYDVYANDLLWNLAAETLGICIAVIQSPCVVYTTHDMSTLQELHQDVVVLCWIGQNHFEPVLREQVSPNGLPRGRFRYDDPLVHAIARIVDC